METGRAEAFSDGVLAIAITLLILAVGIDQALAKGDLEYQFLRLWPAYIAYSISFLTIAHSICPVDGTTALCSGRGLHPSR